MALVLAAAHSACGQSEPRVATTTKTVDPNFPSDGPTCGMPDGAAVGVSFAERYYVSCVEQKFFDAGVWSCHGAQCKATEYAVTYAVPPSNPPAACRVVNQTPEMSYCCPCGGGNNKPDAGIDGGGD
jgi:hypothetical protein